jgi:adenine/guanine/hypoxanthine permease
MLTLGKSATTVPRGALVDQKGYRWRAAGDVNAFFGLMLDNIADLLLTVGLLAGLFQLDAEFALQHLVPGTAIGVLVGDLLFFWLAFRLARRTGRTDVTAMPLGLDTPSTIGMVFFVLGPAYQFGLRELNLSPHDAAIRMWQIGICSIFISGVFKLVCAAGSNWVRRVLPRAGLLGSLAAIALVLISFLPLVEMLHVPVVALVSLAIILTALVARMPLPGRIPGAFGALLVGGTMYWLMYLLDWQFGWHLLHGSASELGDPSKGLLPTGWLQVFTFQWVGALRDTVPYLPIVIPFALATVVGGIDCTESAAAAGDEFDTGQVIAIEAVATIAAALCGGVIQTTPYIGHPAYKAMGGRAAYTLATALFVGAAGLIGFFGYLYLIIPKATVFPILIFVGLEITAQSFLATPKRHYPAVALACVPSLAALAFIFLDKFLGAAGVSPEQLPPNLLMELNILRVLQNGFIVTSLMWASLLAMMIDRRLQTASLFAALMAAFTLFGVTHSPLAGGPMFLPWWLEGDALRSTLEFTAGYGLVALLLFAWDLWAKRRGIREIHSDQPLEGHHA